MATDSEAVFAARAKAVGLTQEHLSKLFEAGFKTLGTFAFSCSYTPGSGDDAVLVESITQVLGAKPQPGVLAACRRLYFEAFTLTASELKQRLDRTEDSAPKKLAAAERSFRYDSQQARLAGLDITGPLEPSDSLVDAACQVYEDNRLRFIPWEQCTCKAQEMAGTRRDSSLAIDPSGNLKLRTALSAEQAELSSDILVQFALRRRGLALDQAQLLDFKLHDRWITKLFEHRLRPVPSGYATVSLRQLRAADEALFTRMAEMCRGGVQITTDGGRPLDAAIVVAMHGPEAMHPLLPLPQAPQARPAQQAKRSAPEASGHAPRGAPRGRGNNRGRGGRQPERRSDYMPPGLEGGIATNPDGVPLCFAYNLGACTRPAKGGRCARGLHLCCKPGCLQPHPMKLHPGASS